MIHPTQGFWADQFLRQLELPVTSDNLVAILAWMHGEGTKAAWNPLATTEPWAGATDFNSSKVKNYRTFVDGINATVATIRLSYYTKVISALRRGDDAPLVGVAIIASPWGTSVVNTTSAKQNFAAFAALVMP